MLLDLTIIFAAALTGGAATKLIDWLVSRRQQNTDYWYVEVKRLTDRLVNLETDVANLKEEADKWRRRYYGEKRDHEETRHQLITDLAKLRAKGEAGAEDIETLYQKFFARGVENAATD